MPLAYGTSRLDGFLSPAMLFTGKMFFLRLTVPTRQPTIKYLTFPPTLTQVSSEPNHMTPPQSLFLRYQKQSFPPQQPALSLTNLLKKIIRIQLPSQRRYLLRLLKASLKYPHHDDLNALQSHRYGTVLMNILLH